jgi:hypothetical protein
MKRYSMMMMAILVTTVLGGATAWAGARWGTEVTIDTANRRAEGTIANVRASNDIVQTIGCVVRANSGAPAEARCYATNSSGLAVQCGSTEPGFVQAVGAMTSNSNIIFKWDAQGTCTYLSIENYSTNAPVEP